MLFSKIYSIILLVFLITTILPANSIIGYGTSISKIYSGSYMGFLGLYDYDNDSIRELFLLQDEGIDVINPMNGNRELFINLSGTFNPYGAIKPLFYDISNGRLYLSIIYDVSSSAEEGYWIITFIIIDLVSGRVLFKDSTIISNTSSYSGIVSSGISGIYRLHFLYNRYFVVFYNGYGDLANPVIFLVYDAVRKHVIHEEIVYKYKGYPGITFPGTLRITSQLVPGGIDPYPPIRFGNNYLFITPNGEVYIFYQNGTLGLINKLNLSSNNRYIILYMPLNRDNVLLLTGPGASLNDYIDLQVYKYDIIHNTIQRLTSLSLTNTTYERLFIQPINSNMFRGLFIRRFVFPALSNPLSASDIVPDNLALLYVFTNNTSYSLNLTTSHKPISQLLKLGNSIYGYMYENNTLNIIDPINLLVGIYPLPSISQYLRFPVTSYIIEKYNDSSLIILGIHMATLYPIYSDIMVVNGLDLNPENMRLKPLGEPLIIPFILVSLIIAYILKRVKNKN